ncbi:Hypothetical predicted protein, partial [Paramuricea clavata]
MTLKSSDNDNTIAADDPNSIADLFNTFFASVFHQDQTHPANETTITDENCLTDIELTVDDILPLLHSLNEHKATGPDGISNKILKETAEQIAPSLCLLFNLSLRSGSLPDDWKISNIYQCSKRGSVIIKLSTYLSFVKYIKSSPTFRTSQNKRPFASL